ncbi:MAG: hypothetical protein AB8G23_10100 [Myxococcota bacterium]
MFETLISLGLIVLFCVIGWALNSGPDSLVWGGIVLAAVGFAYGIPAALVYHWRLHASLSRVNRLPPRWWLNPTSLHGQLPREDRSHVLLWGGLGGSGFLVIVLGILLTSIGLWRMLIP